MILCDATQHDIIYLIVIHSYVSDKNRLHSITQICFALDI